MNKIVSKAGRNICKENKNTISRNKNARSRFYENEISVRRENLFSYKQIFIFQWNSLKSETWLKQGPHSSGMFFLI